MTRPRDGTGETTDDYLNTVFDCEFTSESHFYFVFVRDASGTQAVFSKIAYLFGGDRFWRRNGG